MLKKVLFFLLALLPLFSQAQQLIAFRDTIKAGYNFWVYLPESYDAQKSDLPVIVFLHGQSLCGSELSRVRTYGPLDALGMGRKIDAIIVAPQNPGGAWKPSKVLDVLNWTCQHYSSDTNRVYAIGMSLGGYGTLDFVGTYPEKIAAAMALCGGSTLKSHCGLNKVPLWIIHGTADRDVSVNESKEVVEAMKTCGDTGLLRYDWLPGITHGGLARALYLEVTYEWLLSHSRADEKRHVNRDVVITASTLNQAYQNIDRTANKFTVIDHRKPATASPVLADNPGYHIIKKGDTLYALARKYGTSVDKLCKLNKLKASSILHIGQKLKVM